MAATTKNAAVRRRQRPLAVFVATLLAAALAATVAVTAPQAQAAPCWTEPDPPPSCPDPPPPPSPQPPPPPVAGDNDGDRIRDSYESYLLRKFAPKIWLHYDENRWPVNVGWLLSRSTMRYSHARCRDHEIIPFGQVTSANITEQSHRNARGPVTIPPWNACTHYGTANRSNSYTADPKRSFFLQFLDSSHNGLRDHDDWVLYGHVYPTSSDRIVVQYWQLYAYNDSFASANHEGDWEYTAVVVDRDETPQRVVFFRHGHARDVAPSRVEWEGDHHVTYSAKGSHGQYRAFVGYDGCVSESVADDVQGFADKCGVGTAWDTWAPGFGGILNVGERTRPLNGSNWLRYSGLWGEIGFAADAIDFTSGPQGPAYQLSSWNWHPPSTPPPPPPPTRPAPPPPPPCPPQLPNCQEP